MASKTVSNISEEGSSAMMQQLHQQPLSCLLPSCTKLSCLLLLQTGKVATGPGEH